jgi:Fic family protein
MRIPDRPPGINEVLSEHPQEILSALADPEVMSQLKEYDQRYLHWSELRLRKLNIRPEVAWAIMKIARGMSSQKIEVGTIVLSFNIGPSALRALSVLDQAARRDGLIESSHDALPSSGLLIEEAIASSQLEGAATTREVARKMLLEGRKPRDLSERMILNNHRAMDLIKGYGNRKLDSETLDEIHRTLTQGTLDDPSQEGSIRRTNDVVVSDPLQGTVYHQPPDLTEVPSMLRSLFDLFNQKEETHPLVTAMIVHYLIGHIHPYHDGNGRLARALMYWYGLRKGYWFLERLSVSKVIKASRSKYGNAYLFSETDGNDVTYFLSYNLECLEKALKEAEERTAIWESQKAEALDLSIRDPRLNARQAQILKVLRSYDRPVSINEVKGEFGVVYQTARTDLLTLRDQGYLEMRVKGRKMLFHPTNFNGGRSPPAAPVEER